MEYEDEALKVAWGNARASVRPVKVHESGMEIDGSGKESPSMCIFTKRSKQELSSCQMSRLVVLLPWGQISFGRPEKAAEAGFCLFKDGENGS